MRVLWFVRSGYLERMGRGATDLVAPDRRTTCQTTGREATRASAATCIIGRPGACLFLSLFTPTAAQGLGSA
jgi:hypothetical protein